MPLRQFRVRTNSTVWLACFASAVAQAQWFDWVSPSVPRTADGRVDLAAPAPRMPDDRMDMSGVWVPNDARGTLFDTSKIQGWALDEMLKQEQSFYTNDPRFHCLPSGPSNYPAGPSVGGARRMVQHSDYIAILNPDMTYRQVFMDGRPLEAEPLLPTWMGYSTGHWDGDVLVIESNGYKATTWLTREGLPHTELLRITERYTRHDYGHITLDVTYEDPGTFTEPVQATIDLVNQPDNTLQEVICNESETGAQHYTGEISQADTEVVQLPLETLQKYVGTYQGIWLGNQITTEFSVSDGQLVLRRTPRYSDTGGNTDFVDYRLVAQSETAFDCTCGLGFVFTVGEDGVATEVSEVHVSGAWAFRRVDE
ncbi:MAG: hypothetical protein ACO1PZ_03910 [Gammaproteobacteria bacterium]